MQNINIGVSVSVIGIVSDCSTTFIVFLTAAAIKKEEILVFVILMWLHWITYFGLPLHAQLHKLKSNWNQ